MTKEAENISGDFRWMNRWRYRVPMPNAVGITYTPTENVEVIPFIETDTIGCWNELETTEYTARNAVFNPEAGEQEGKFIMCAQVTRKLADKEQRVYVMGDVDMFCNGELSQKRKGFNSGENRRLLYHVYSYLTEGEFPVDVDRVSSTDTALYIGLDSLIPSKIGFIGVFPALLTILWIAIQIRRKRK